jgi:type I restriction enzyme M protein
MLTGEIRNQIDRIWDAFWSGGISNPLEVIEQITYLLFIKRLDDLHTLEESKAARLKKPLERRVFPEGKDKKKRSYEDYRWSHFKNFAPAEMYTVVSEHVFPFLRTLGGDDSTYAHHMKDARFTIPTPALLAKVVDLLDHVPMEERDTKGDLYEYMLGKIASAGQNGQFRKPRHIIRLMVELTVPPHPRMSSATQPAARAASWWPRASTCVSDIPRCSATPSSSSIFTTACSTASTSITPCSASAA